MLWTLINAICHFISWILTHYTTQIVNYRRTGFRFFFYRTYAISIQQVFKCYQSLRPFNQTFSSDFTSIICNYRKFWVEYVDKSCIITILHRCFSVHLIDLKIIFCCSTFVHNYFKSHFQCLVLPSERIHNAVNRK